MNMNDSFHVYVIRHIPRDTSLATFNGQTIVSRAREIELLNSLPFDGSLACV